MRRTVGEVEEERFPLVLFDEPDRVARRFVMEVSAGGCRRLVLPEIRLAVSADVGPPAGYPDRYPQKYPKP